KVKPKITKNRDTIRHTAWRKCRISSFEKGGSCGSFPGARPHHRHRPRALWTQQVPVRFHRAAFFHIRQQRCFFHSTNLFSLQRLAWLHEDWQAVTLPYWFFGVLTAEPRATCRASRARLVR